MKRPIELKQLYICELAHILIVHFLIDFFLWLQVEVSDRGRDDHKKKGREGSEKEAAEKSFRIPYVKLLKADKT